MKKKKKIFKNKKYKKKKKKKKIFKSQEYRKAKKKKKFYILKLSKNIYIWIYIIKKKE